MNLGFSSDANLKIIDGGVYFGAFSLLMANAYPNSEIVGIEANIENIELIDKNMHSYVKEGFKFEILNKALDNSSDKILKLNVCIPMGIGLQTKQKEENLSKMNIRKTMRTP